MKNEQVNEVVAMLMIGDCVLGALAPERHVRLWKIGPPRLRQALEGLAHRPNLTPYDIDRWIGARYLVGCATSC
jgi:hypothetical protein